MGENSQIQWTDHTFNPWIGCQRVSPGCVNCYAEHRNPFVRVSRGKGRELWGPKGDRHITAESTWKQPLTWNRKAEKAGKRARVFCASLADVFEDRRDLDDARDGLFELIEMTPHLDWLLLTKRTDRVMDLVKHSWRDGFPSNVWMGTSVEDQKRVDERVPELIKIPAKVRFLSAEPLLESITLAEYFCNRPTYGAIHWLIIGGESGDGARVFDVDWVRSLIVECFDGAVMPFVKQLGAIVRFPAHEWRGRSIHDIAYTPDGGMLGFRLKDSHGGDWNEWPEDLRIRQWPA